VLRKKWTSYRLDRLGSQVSGDEACRNLQSILKFLIEWAIYRTPKSLNSHGIHLIRVKFKVRRPGEGRGQSPSGERSIVCYPGRRRSAHKGLLWGSERPFSALKRGGGGHGGGLFLQRSVVFGREPLALAGAKARVVPPPDFPFSGGGYI
jgi:hypothetical protein